MSARAKSWDNKIRKKIQTRKKRTKKIKRKTKKAKKTKKGKKIYGPHERLLAALV